MARSRYQLGVGAGIVAVLLTIILNLAILGVTIWFAIEVLRALGVHV